MYTFISIFYVSLFAMILMVWLKRHEVNTGKRTVVSRLGQSIDHVFIETSNRIRTITSYINRHTFLALIQWIAFHVLLRIRRVYVHAKYKALQNPHGKRLIDAVRGRGEIKRHGASFYLRRISEN